MRKNLLYLTTKMFGWIMLLVSLMAFEEAKATDVTIETAKSHYEADKTFQSHYGEENVNVTLSGRSFTSNQLDGVCFPFTATADVIKNTLGDGVVIYELSSVEGSTFTFTPKADASVVAGVPYLVKPSQDVTDPVFSGVQLANTIDDSFLTHTLSTSDFAFRGYYFLKYQDVLYDSSNAHTFYYLDTDGTFKDASTSGVWKNGWTGSYAYFYVADKNNLPTIIISGSGGSGSGGEGEGGGGSSSGVYASRTQLNSCVPTVYIDIMDAVMTGDGKKPLEGTKGQEFGKGMYKFYNTSNEEVIVSDELIAENPDITVGFRQNRFTTYYKQQYSTKSENYDLARIQIIDESGSIKERDELTTIRGRGNSTWNSLKKAFRLKFPSKTGLLKKADGTNEYADAKSWTLIANAADHTLIRNALASELGKYVGMPYNPAYKFVDLVVNGEYYGTYQICDHNQVAPKRVDIDETNGWFLEVVPGTDHKYAEAPCFAASALTATVGVNVKNPEVDNDSSTDPAIVAIKDWFNDILGPSFNSFSEETGYRNYVDIPSLVDYIIVNEITGNYDGTVSNYIYKDASDTKLHFGPIWDNDLSFGSYGDGKKDKWVFENTDHYAPLNTFVAKIFEDPVFLQALVDKWDKVYGYNTETGKSALQEFLLNKINTITSDISCSIEDNNEKWNTNTTWVAGIESHNFETYDAALQEIKDFIPTRLTWLNTNIHAKLDAVKGTSFTLDASATNASDKPFSEVENKVVTLNVTNRSYTANEWSTICLPAGLDEDRLKTAFGDDVELREYTGLDASNHMKFEPVTPLALQAGVPYLIKPSKAVSNPSFEGVVLTIQQPKEIKYGESDAVSFCGSFYKKSISATDLTYNVSDAAFKTAGAIDLTGVQAYVKASSADVVMPLEPSDILPRLQLTDLPTVFIDVDDNATIVKDNYVTGKMQIIDDSATPALTPAKDVVINIKGRGTTTWTGTDKKSYKLKFGSKIDLVNQDGAAAKKKWVLLANAGDKSLVRNALTYEIAKIANVGSTPHYRFVDLVLNGKYVGTYQFTDPVEINKGRILVSNEDTDWLLDMTTSAQIETGDVALNGTDGTKPYVNIKNPEPSYLDTDDEATKTAAINAVKTPVQTYFDAFWNTLSTADMDVFKDETNGFRKYIDMESFINWYIATEILGGYESLTSIYSYKDDGAGSKLFFGPLWSNDASYDNHQSLDMTSKMADLSTDNSYNGLVFNAGNTTSAWNSKLAAMWQDPLFAAAVYDRWTEIYNAGALTTTLTGKVDAMAATLKSTTSHTKSSQELNFTTTENGGAGWSLSGAGVTGVTKSTAFANYDAAVTQLKNYLTARMPYLEEKFSSMVGVINVDYDVTKADAITYYSQYNNKTVNVNLKNRGTITKDYWNPITLPFDATQSQMEAVFGTGYELEQFNGVETSGDQVSVLKFAKVQPKDVVAGIPYLIKPSADVSTLSFTDVTFNASEEKSVDVSGGYSFCGLLQKQVFNPDKTHLFVGKNNKFVRLGSSATLTGARAYFTIPEEAYSKQFSYGQDDEIVTGLRTIAIEMDTTNTKIYNLNGQFIGTSLRMLPHGIYIVNGKKIVK